MYRSSAQKSPPAAPSAPAPGRTLAERRAEARRRHREQLARRVVHPVSPATRRVDPLPPRRVGRGRSTAALVAFALVAVSLHVGLALGLSGLTDGERPEIRKLRPEQVVVRVVERPAPPVIDRPEPPPTAEPEAPAISPAPPPPAEEAPVLAKKPRKRPPRTAPRPPADPVDVDDAPPPTPAETQRRRVIGISMESTVAAGSGPSYAVGNTRMGQTERQAADPSGVEKLAPGTTGIPGRGGPDGGPVPLNRAAANIPTARSSFTKPKRLSSVQLDYPPLLKTQGIEGNVVMLIRIGPDGRVESARVLKSSGYDEFDSIARRAASSERFSPATRDGEPVEYTLKYTYRFRIKDA